MMRWRIVVVGSVAGLLAVTGLVVAGAHGVFERLVMPGALSSAHAELENQCTYCHRPFSRGTQDDLCLACHKDIAADRSVGTGMHGRSREVAGSACRRCHAEHQGRNVSIVSLSENLFDHTVTDFAIEGGHRAVACRSCHKVEGKFRLAAHLCVSCHAAADPHKGELGQACEQCHNTGSWTKTTPWPHLKWPLQGVHARTNCRACHAGSRFADLPKDCDSCHRGDDAHRGKLGTDCGACHTAVAWTVLRAGVPTPARAQAAKEPPP
jgi:hypothetical protein